MIFATLWMFCISINDCSIASWLYWYLFYATNAQKTWRM